MRRRLDPSHRRAQILEAAARAFARRPYAEVQLQAIAADVGASRGLINHYFGDKRGLFLAVAQSEAGRLQAALPAPDMSLEDSVAATARAWLDFVESSGEASLALGGGLLMGDAELEPLHDEIRDLTARRLLAARFGEGDVPNGAHATMRAAVGLIEQAARDCATGRGATRERTQEFIVRSVLAIIHREMP